MTLRDPFTRADGALGSNWTALVGTNPYSIISNVAASNGASAENCTVYNAFTPGNDQWAEVTLTQAGADAYVGPAVRGAGTSWYVFYGDSGNRALYRIVSGTPTSLASSATGFAVNDVIRLEVEGTTLRAYVNGVLWTSVTDSSLSSGNTGMATWSTSTSGRVDNFSADNISTDLNVTANLIATSETIYQATVTAGAVTVTANLIATAETLYNATVTQIQVARPTSTISAGAWTDQLGGTTDMHSPLADESDSTWIQSEFAPSSSFVEVALGTLSDPGVNTGHAFAYRYDKTPAISEQMDLTVQLRQGASTVIATATHTNISGSIVDGELTLSGAEADAITDWNDLRLRFIGNQV